jgi:hypothetical protein
METFFRGIMHYVGIDMFLYIGKFKISIHRYIPKSIIPRSLGLGLSTSSKNNFPLENEKYAKLSTLFREHLVSTC